MRPLVRQKRYTERRPPPRGNLSRVSSTTVARAQGRKQVLRKSRASLIAPIETIVKHLVLVYHIYIYITSVAPRALQGCKESREVLRWGDSPHGVRRPCQQGLVDTTTTTTNHTARVASIVACAGGVCLRFGHKHTLAHDRDRYSQSVAGAWLGFVGLEVFSLAVER